MCRIHLVALHKHRKCVKKEFFQSNYLKWQFLFPDEMFTVKASSSDGTSMGIQSPSTCIFPCNGKVLFSHSGSTSHCYFSNKKLMEEMKIRLWTNRMVDGGGWGASFPSPPPTSCLRPNKVMFYLNKKTFPFQKLIATRWRYINVENSKCRKRSILKNFQYIPMKF